MQFIAIHDVDDVKHWFDSPHAPSSSRHAG